MKFRLRNKKNAGFTITEIIISIAVLSLLFLVIMYLYGRSSDSFKITLWKQQRTAQSEIFWTHMRKHLEEATNELNLPDPFDANPDINVVPRPLKFNPTAATLENGIILAWRSSKINFKFEPSPNHSITENTFFLLKKGRTVELKSGSDSISKIEDVEVIDVKATSVLKTSENDETFVNGANPDALGTVIEISITLSPPKGYLAEDLKLPQSHKFRLTVGSAEDSSPSY